MTLRSRYYPTAVRVLPSPKAGQMLIGLLPSLAGGGWMIDLNQDKPGFKRRSTAPTTLLAEEKQKKGVIGSRDAKSTLD